MRKLALAAITAAALGIAGPALAETIQGTVSSYNADMQQVTLQSGETFKLEASVDPVALKEGAKVTLNVEDIGGTRMVTEVQVN